MSRDKNTHGKITLKPADNPSEDPWAETAAHLRVLLENTHDLIILTTETGIPIYANRAWQQRFGDPMAVSDPFARVHPEDTDRVQQAWQEMLTGRKNLTDLQYRIITPEGRVLVFESTAREIPGGGERLFYVLTHEATSRVQAESALKESESKFRYFFDRNPTLMTVSRLRDGQYFEVNDTFCQKTGYSREEIIGRTSIDIGLWVEPATRVEIIARVETEGHFSAEPRSLRMKDGSVREFLWSAEKVTIDGEDCLFNTLVDVTEENRAQKLIRENEEKYRLLVEHQSDLVVKVDTQGRFLFVSPSYCRMFGKHEKDLLGRSFLPMVHEDDRKATVRAMENIYRPPYTCYIEQRALTRSGRRWLAWVYSAVVDENAEVTAVIGAGRDITEKRQRDEAYAEKVALLALSADIGKVLTRAGRIEEALQACADRLVRHLKAAFARIWILEEHSQMLVLKASAGMYTRIDGAHAQIPVDHYPFKIGVIAREKRAIFTNAVVGDPHIHDQEWARREGIKAFAGHPLVVDETVVGVIGTFFHHPITESALAALSSVADEIALGVFRNQAQTALRESEEKYRLIFDNASDAIFIAQGETIKFPNKAALAAIGYAPDELARMKLSELIHSDDGAESVAQHRQRLPGAPLPPQKPYRVIRKDGHAIWVEPTVVSIQWEGKPASLNFLRDITSRRIMEERLERAQRLEAIGTLAGGIAHDFNNILSAIIGYTEIAMMDVADGAPLKRNLTKVMQAGERARNLVQQILAFSRQKDPEPKPVQIRLIAAEALKLLRATLPTTIAIEKRLNSDAAVMADPTQIHQVVMNLCTNAAQAMRDTGGTLTITLETVELGFDFISQHAEVGEGRYLRLSVKDTGPGIPKDIQERVFDPFFTTKPPGEGTGLGLSVVHGIALAHGGMATVESTPGAGATFHVYLPAIDMRAPEAMETVSPMPTGNERVLMVDDERFQVDLGRQMLERLGYSVDTYTDSSEALSRFLVAPHDYDLVITDMTMPRLTGEQLARQVLAARPGTPVIICTGYSDIINEEKAAAMGVGGFIMKPVIMKDFAALVRDVLDGQ